MTIAERNKKLKHLIDCLKCRVSGRPCHDECSTGYDAGTMGEIIENLEVISKVLELNSDNKKIMTNGEKILAAFPNAIKRVCRNKGITYIEVEQNNKWIGDFDIEWWNSRYEE